MSDVREYPYETRLNVLYKPLDFGACEKLPIPANRDYPATLRRGGSGTVAG